MKALVAVPSENPGGLDAPLGAHFGHCAMYTLINVEDAQIKDVKVIPNMPHEQGGCMAPVNYLSDNGVKALIAGGMGMRQDLFLLCTRHELWVTFIRLFRCSQYV